MNKPPAFQFYAQDFLTGVMYMTNEEKGIYITMLAKQWTDEKIPKKRLGFLVGFDWDKLSDELKSKFDDRGEYVVNKRLEAEREKQKAYLEKQKANGKKGGRPPKNHNNQKPNPNPKKPIEVEDEVEGEEEKDNENEDLLWPNFEDFWDLYDKKVGNKKKIKKKWGKLNQKTKEYIMQYIPHYRQAQPDKAYRKNPETFFNNESWNDEIIIKPTLGKKDEAVKNYFKEEVNNIRSKWN